MKSPNGFDGPYVEVGNAVIFTNITTPDLHTEFLTRFPPRGMNDPTKVGEIREWLAKKNSDCVVCFGPYAKLRKNLLTVLLTPGCDLILNFTGREDKIWQLAKYFHLYDNIADETLYNLPTWAKSRKIPYLFSLTGFRGLLFFFKRLLENLSGKEADSPVR